VELLAAMAVAVAEPAVLYTMLPMLLQLLHILQLWVPPTVVPTAVAILASVVVTQALLAWQLLWVVVLAGVVIQETDFQVDLVVVVLEAVEAVMPWLVQLARVTVAVADMTMAASQLVAAVVDMAVQAQALDINRVVMAAMDIYLQVLDMPAVVADLVGFSLALLAETVRFRQAMALADLNTEMPMAERTLAVGAEV
jgi:hypothetical protein